MSTWSDMNLNQRNTLVASLMNAELMSRCYVAVGGKRIRMTPYGEKERMMVVGIIAVLKADDEAWAEFKAQEEGTLDEWRDKLEVDVEKWPMNYAGTPGGAWFVVEWLIGEGFDVTVFGGPDVAGFEAEAIGHKQGMTVTAPTMAEAVCQLLLKLKAPEALER